MEKLVIATDRGHRAPPAPAQALIAACLLGANPLTAGEWEMVETVDLAPDVHHLIEVQQLSSDVEVRVELPGGQTHVADGPDERDGVEFVLLAPAPQSQRAALSVRAVHQGVVAANVRVTSRSVTDSATLDLLATLQDAFDLWAAGTAVSRAAAIPRFRAALEAPSAASGTLLIEAYRHWGRAALLESALEETGEIVAAAQTIAGPDYQLSWILGDVLFEQSSFAEAEQAYAMALQLLATKLSSAPDRLAYQLNRLELEAVHATARLLAARLAGITIDREPLRQTVLDALQQAVIIGDRLTLARLHNTSVPHHFTAGDFSDAISSLRIALALFEETGAALGTASTLNNLGFVYSQLGNLGLAEHFLSRAFQIFEARGLQRFGIPTLYNLASTYEAIGDSARAATLFRRLIDDYSTNGNRLEAAQARFHADRLGTPTAEERLEQHLVLLQAFREHGSIRDEMAALIALSSAAAQLGNAADAGDYAEQAWSLRDFRMSFDRSVLAAERLIAVARQAGNIERMRRITEETLDAVGYPDRVAPQLLGIIVAAVEARLARGDERDVDELTRAAIRIVTSTSAGMDAVRLAPSWSGKAQEAINRLILAFHSAGDGTTSDVLPLIEILEHTRATAMRLQRARARENTRSFAAASEELQALWQTYVDARRALATAPESADRQALELHAYESELTYRAGTDQTPATLRADLDAPISAERMLASLTRDDLVIQFLLGEEYGLAFYSTAEGTEVIRLPSRQHLEAWGRRLREAILRDDRRWIDIANSLPVLDADLVRASSARRLLVVPQGTIAQLPLSLLSIAAGLQVEVTLVPSLSLYFAAPKPVPNKVGRLDLAIFSDPELGNGGQRSYGGANAIPSSWLASLQPLQWSRIEAERMSAELDQFDVEQYLGQRMTLQNLLSEAVRSSRVLHIASHGYADPRIANLVGVVMYDPGHRSGQLLTSLELSRLDFANELVVVNSCDSSRGSTSLGEGALSLTRAFLSQGAAAAIGSLWPISDRAAAVFMEALYEQLAQGRDPGVAIAQARQTLRSRRVFAQPRHWAAYEYYSLRQPGPVF